MAYRLAYQTEQELKIYAKAKGSTTKTLKTTVTPEVTPEPKAGNSNSIVYPKGKSFTTRVLVRSDIWRWKYGDLRQIR